MSSYIVGNVTINRIISFIQDGCLYQEELKAYECLVLAKKMCRMNIKAVCQKYNEAPDKYKQIAKDWAFEYVRVEKTQVLKSLQCYLYQCSEYTVPRMKLFKQLRDLERELMNQIIKESTNYNEKEWD